MAEETNADRIIGTAEAADLLGWSRRKVQRVVKKAIDTGSIDIKQIVDQVGARGEYVLHASDLTKLEEATHTTP